MRRTLLLVALVVLALVMVAPAAAGAPPRGLTYEVTCPGMDTFEVTGIGTMQGWTGVGPPVLLMGGEFWRTEAGVTTYWAIDPPAGLVAKLATCRIEGPTGPDAGFSILMNPAYLLFVG
jgi:hypothetical protein